jgi:hypothetical protein
MCVQAARVGHAGAMKTDVSRFHTELYVDSCKEVMNMRLLRV